MRAHASLLLRSLIAALTLVLLATFAPAASAQEPAPADSLDDTATLAEPAEPAPAADPNAEYEDTDPRAVTDFKPELDPYGDWVEHPKYGLVWVPHQHVVGVEFAPYVTSGHWALTDDGDWIWVSDYPFGWVVFHYGRWVWVPGTGWAWIPGRRYAHAWVVWRVPTGSYAYVGWAPAPPAYVWVDGVAVAVWYHPPTPYVFCHTHYVFSYRVHHHIVLDRHRVHRIARHSRRYVPPGRVPRRGPTMRAARIPPQRIPSIRTPANPRAVAAARPSSFGGRSGATPTAGSKARAAGPVRATPKSRGGRAVPATRAAPGGRSAARPATRYSPATRRTTTSRLQPPRASTGTRRSVAKPSTRYSTPSRSSRQKSNRLRSVGPRLNSESSIGGTRAAPGGSPARLPRRPR